MEYSGNNEKLKQKEFYHGDHGGASLHGVERRGDNNRGC